MTALSEDQVACVRCAAPYRPALTYHRCPVCSTAAPGPAPRLRVWDDPDDRLLAIVAFFTLANVLVLAVVAAVVLS